MATISILDRSTDADLQPTPRAPESCDDQEWAIRRIRQADVAAVKILFCKLHAFNAALDLRFALSQDWETHFLAAIQQALCSDESLCLIARQTGTHDPWGFVLAGVHRDASIWRYHEWVEVEALYVEDAWRGRGLAEILLARAYEWADRSGQTVVQLYVTASNARAIRFYQREGFRQTQAIMRKILA